jgi:sugar lactone lactonase YvrE
VNAPVHKRVGVSLLVMLTLAMLLWNRPCEKRTTVLAQSGSEWSEPVMVSTNTVKAWFSDIAVDNQGHAHIVWHSERREDQGLLDLLMYTTWNGETYSEPNDIVFPGIGGYTVRPVIAADSQGKLHMAYRDNVEICYTQAPADGAWSAASWTSPRYLSEGRSSYYSDIAVDSKGVIHVVWNEQAREIRGDKTLWFGTLHGVNRLQGQWFQSSDSQSWAGDYAVYAMLEDSQGVQWFGTSVGLGRYDGVTWQWLSTSDGLAGNEVFALANDMDGTLWLGTDRGLSHYDPLQSKSKRWMTVLATPELAPHRIQAIAVDSGGNVWVGTSGGLGVYSGRVWSTYHSEDGLASENVTAIEVDRDDVLWVGTDGGLMKYADENWSHLTTRDGLSGDGVTALAVGPDNVLWVGTESGLTRYDGQAWQTFTSTGGLINDYVTSLVIGGEGVLWVGTPVGISRYDEEEGWTRYTVEDGLVDGHVTAIAKDRILNAMCPGCMDVFYRRSDDGGSTWSAPANLSNSYAGSVKPQIKIDNNDGVHVTWEEGEDWYLSGGYPVGSVHRYSADGGTTWSDPFMFTHPDGAPQQITLGIGRAGELVAVWRLPRRLLLGERSAVYYQRSTDDGASWSDPQPIEGIIAKDWEPMSLDSCHSASDSAGNVHLLVLGYLSPLEEILSLIYVVWDGQEWSRPYRLYTSTNPPEWPRIAVGMGNSVHATWFTRDEAHIWDAERGRYQVWAARRQADAPSLPPVPTSVPLPTSTVTPTVPVVSNPTPMPMIPAGSAPPSGIYTDADDTVRLVIALLPVGGLIGVLFVARRLWRRLW